MASAIKLGTHITDLENFLTDVFATAAKPGCGESVRY